MSSSATSVSASSSDVKMKPCCACPDTRKARDSCILENGEEKCAKMIALHRACMAQYGFVTLTEEDKAILQMESTEASHA